MLVLFIVSKIIISGNKLRYRLGTFRTALTGNKFSDWIAADELFWSCYASIVFLKWNRNKGCDSMIGVKGLTLNPFVSFPFYVALWPGIFVASVLILFWQEHHSCWDLIQLNSFASIPKKLKITHPQLGSGLLLNKRIPWAQTTVDNWPKYRFYFCVSIWIQVTSFVSWNTPS